MNKALTITTIFLIMSCISFGFVGALWLTYTEDPFEIKNEFYVMEEELSNLTSINGRIRHGEYIVIRATPDRNDVEMLQTFTHELAHWYAHEDAEHFCGWYVEEQIEQKVKRG